MKMLVIHVGSMLVSDFAVYNPAPVKKHVTRWKWNVLGSSEPGVRTGCLSLAEFVVQFRSFLSVRYGVLGQAQNCFWRTGQYLAWQLFYLRNICAGEYETLQSDLHSCHGKSIIKVWSIYLPYFSTIKRLEEVDCPFSINKKKKWFTVL